MIAPAGLTGSAEYRSRLMITISRTESLMIPATNKWRRTVTMNNSRRKRISKIADALNVLKGQIDELYEEEQEAFENIPESLQGD